MRAGNGVVIPPSSGSGPGGRVSSSRSGTQGYTTVRRYKIPDHSLEQDTYEDEMRLVHRGGRSEIFDDRRSTKDYVVERSVVGDRDVQGKYFDSRTASP